MIPTFDGDVDSDGDVVVDCREIVHRWSPANTPFEAELLVGCDARFTVR